MSTNQIGSQIKKNEYFILNQWKKKAFSDLAINIFASTAIVIALQIITLPYIGRNVSADYFGFIVSLYGISNIVILFLGTALNNARLLENGKYIEKNITGDFSILLIISVIFSVIIMLAIVHIYSKLILQDKIIFVIITALGIIRSYATVYFRLELKYKSIFYNSICLCIGYGIGILLYKLIKIPTLSLLLGELFALVNILISTPILKDKLSITKLLYNTVKSFTSLSISSLCASLSSYMDRIIIIPILGAGNSSIYYTASFASKMFSIISSPISNVMLSYLARIKKDKFRQYYVIISIVFLSLSIIIFLLLAIFSPIVLKILYPQFYYEAIKYVYLTNIAVALSISITLLWPIMLRYCPISLRIVTQVINVVSYMILALVLMHYFGLYGYCYAVIIENIMMVTLLLVMTRKYIQNAYNCKVNTTK